MTLRECYDACGGDYENVMSRLLSEERVTKFLRKFVNGQNPNLLAQAIEKKDGELAFREAHNLKGVCANLGLTRLGSIAGELTELLRGYDTTSPAVKPLLEEVQEQYQQVVDSVNAIS